MCLFGTKWVYDSSQRVTERMIINLKRDRQENEDGGMMDRKKVKELFQLLSYCHSFQLTWSWHWCSESDIWAWPAGFLIDFAERERERETRGWLQGWRWEEGLACPCMPVVPATITLAMLLHVGSDTSFLKQQLKPVCSFSVTLRTSFMAPSQRQQTQPSSAPPQRSGT